MAWLGLTDQNIHNEIQYTLLETPNSGASYNSGLYTSAEVQARLLYRIYNFAKRTGYLVKHTTLVTLPNSSIVIPPTDCVDILRLAYPDINGTIVVIPRGSTEEAQAFVADLNGSNASVDVPSIYTTDIGATLDIEEIILLPPPNASRTLQCTYIARPAALAATPSGAAIDAPKEFCHLIKYGVLADLFLKAGETYDPLRSQICEQLYELGVQVAIDTIHGSNLTTE